MILECLSSSLLSDCKQLSALSSPLSALTAQLAVHSISLSARLLSWLQQGGELFMARANINVKLMLNAVLAAVALLIAQWSFRASFSFIKFALTGGQWRRNAGGGRREAVGVSTRQQANKHSCNLCNVPYLWSLWLAFLLSGTLVRIVRLRFLQNSFVYYS